MNDGGRRVLVIGLDGATLDVIVPWVKQGKLPNFEKLLSAGSYGPLKATVPAMTFPSWTSFMTGTNPGKHGVFDFSEREPGTYGIRFINANWVKSATIWRILSEAGKRVAAISVPVTFPPEAVNGLMISGFDAPGLSRGKADARCMYPPALYDELEHEVGGYTLTANAVALAGEPDKALQAILTTMDQKIRSARYLYRKEPWDLFMIVLGETDAIAHYFWKYHDPGSPLHAAPPSQACADAILAVYQRADAFIGDLLQEAGESTTTVIVSDHGTGGCGDTAVHLNRWLSENGFLRFVASDHRAILATCADRIKSVAVKLLPAALKSWIARSTPLVVNRMESYLRFNGIDWSQTQAFADENPYYPEIWINVEGREPEGRVRPGADYESVRNILIESLQAWKDSETGERVIQRVWKREELYTGPFVDRAPDLLIEWNLKRGYSYVPRLSKAHDGIESLRKMTPAECRDVKSGSHRDFGVLALYGDGIRQGGGLNGAEMVDVAPTLLYLLGLPIPEDMDGKVLETVIDEGLLIRHPVTYDGARGPNARREQDYSDEDAAVVEERLKSLGYIE